MSESRLFLQSAIGEFDKVKVEIRTQGSSESYQSYCFVLTEPASYSPLELESYSNELDAREGHLAWLGQRERCFAHLEALGLINRKSLIHH